MSTGLIAGSRPSRSAVSIVSGIGLAVIAIYILALFLLMDRGSYDIWGAFLVAPVLIAITLPMLARQARREADPTLFRLLVLGLIVKLAGSIARYFVAFTVYEGAADAEAYHKAGLILGERFRHFDFVVGDAATGGAGTKFVKIVAGVAYALIGPTKLGAFVLFSWMGFLGLFFFYRAFVIAVPAGRARSYAHFIFFVPSLVFWPSSLGKEGWMMLMVGVASFGVAKVLTHDVGRGLLAGAVGVWGTTMVRPHVGALIGVAFAFAVILRKPSAGLRELGPLVRVVSIGFVAAVSLFLVVRTADFLQMNNIETEEGLSTAATDVQDRTSQGGSEFTPASVVDDPLNLPVAVVTVLFRPLPIEAHNAQAMVSALEGSALLLIVVLRLRWIIAALKLVPRTPYLVYAIAYAGLFIVGFSSFGNFGILARERVQLYPLFLVLLSVPPVGWPRPADHGPRRREALADA